MDASTLLLLPWGDWTGGGNPNPHPPAFSPTHTLSLKEYPSHSHQNPSYSLWGWSPCHCSGSQHQTWGEEGGEGALGILQGTKKWHPSSKLNTRGQSFIGLNCCCEDKTGLSWEWECKAEADSTSHFAPSSHKKAWEGLSPSPTGAAPLLPGLRPTAMQGCAKPWAVFPTALQQEGSQRPVSNTERGSAPQRPAP